MLCENYKVSEIWSAPLRDAWVRLLIMQTFWCFGCFWQWHLRCTLVSLAFTPFGCKRFWRPGAHHLILIMLWWIFLSDWGKIDDDRRACRQPNGAKHTSQWLPQQSWSHTTAATAEPQLGWSALLLKTVTFHSHHLEAYSYPWPQDCASWDRYLSLRSFAGIASTASILFDVWISKQQDVCWPQD